MSKSVKDNNKTDKNEIKTESKTESKKTENAKKNDKNIIIEQESIKENIVLSELKKKELSGVDISDLFFLEKICALICKRYETSARINNSNNEKFKEFKFYYDRIFSELERRILDICKL